MLDSSSPTLTERKDTFMSIGQEKYKYAADGLCAGK